MKRMSAIDKLKLNSIIQLIYQVSAIVVGLVIPRLILGYYGSEVNGLVTSITQMLSVVMYFDFGISAVAQATMYKPLEENDFKKISEVYFATRKYFNFLLGLLIIYVVVLIPYYASTNIDRFSPMYTITLLLAISFSSVGEYVLGMSNQVLLAADQKIYVYTLINIFLRLINAVMIYVMIFYGSSIQLVKLCSSAIFLAKPFILEIYVRKNYLVKKPEYVSLKAIPERWSGMVQHIANTLTASLDTIVLTLFSTLKNVSIYNVYIFPLNGVKLLLDSIMGSYKSYLGHILVSKTKDEVNRNFRHVEFLLNALAITFLCMSYKLLVPFVKVYTLGINDANYDQKKFAIVISLAYFFLMIRGTYNTAITAAGQFKNTQIHCIIETILNLILSVLLVKKYGLVGVAIGTCISSVYRVCASIMYLRNNILFRGLRQPLKLIFMDMTVFLLFICITNAFENQITGYFAWACWSVMYFFVEVIVFLLVSLILEKEETKVLIGSFLTFIHLRGKQQNPVEK